MRGHLIQRRHRAYSETAAAVVRNDVQSGDPSQIDQAARREQAFLHQIQQIDAACLQNVCGVRRVARMRVEHRVRHCRRGGACGLPDAAGVGPFEPRHRHRYLLAASAARIAARFIGKARSRTPIAL